MPHESHVVLADPDPAELDELARALRATGHAVRTASRAEDVLAQLRAAPVHALVLSLHLPDPGGSEVCRRIRSDPRLRGLPVIMLTPDESAEQLLTCLDAGADDSLFRSCDRRVLQARLRIMLQRAHGQEQLAAERAHVEAWADSITEALVVLDPEGRLVRTNRAADALFGWAIPVGADPEQRAAAWALETLDGRPVGAAELPGMRVLRTARPLVDEVFQVRRADGARRVITITSRPIGTPEAMLVGAVVVGRDVTEQHQVRAELARQRQLAEEATRRKSYMLAALSHDIRTPLNGIVLCAQLLRIESQDRLTPVQEQCLHDIEASVRTTLDLISDLLDLSRIDAGRVACEPSDFDVAATIRESVASVRPLGVQKGLAIGVDLGEIAGSTAHTDRAKLKQILGNLLSNAIKYTPRGSITVRGRRDGAIMTIEVADTGIGVAAEDQERIFEEFTMLNNPARPSGEGTGLGLAISRRLATILGGELTVASTPGRGSAFTLRFPARVAPTAASGPSRGANGTGGILPGAGESVAAAGRAARRAHILIVEDSLISRRSLARLLRGQGFEVTESGNGREALARAAERPPDLILMDLLMPVLDGIEATRLIKADPRLASIPVWALTADLSQAGRDRALDAGVAGFLTKPIDLPVLLRALGESGG